MPARWLSRLHRAEDGLLAALLGSLLLLSVAQIVLRVVFDALNASRATSASS